MPLVEQVHDMTSVDFPHNTQGIISYTFEKYMQVGIRTEILQLITTEKVERLRTKECDDGIIPVRLIHYFTWRVLAALVLGF